MSESPGRVVAASLGLSAFAVAIVAGLAAGASTQDILLRAVVSLFVCVLIGRAIAHVGVRAMDEAAHAYRESNPIDALAPTSDDEATEPARAAPGHRDAEPAPARSAAA
ncbi:MAG: hypothetical protein D6693_02635 [Planctomycetota bacterium]|nr:MAG: hypothetical protein D6693_02635 [Planctomycetota bacterium]